MRFSLSAPAADREDTAQDGPELFKPNDPYYKHQWHLDQINMPQAWTRSRGAGVVVAVIDTGVSFEDHRRRRQRWVRAPDLASTKFVPGYDFVDGDAHPNDDHGHGTHGGRHHCAVDQQRDRRCGRRARGGDHAAACAGPKRAGKLWECGGCYPLGGGP